MRISFVIPAFNAEGTLEETLRSVCAQSIDEWEAIVVDDGSTDGTARVADACADDRVTLVRQENRGLAGARNAGLSRATGEVVAFLDADDTVSPDYAARMTTGLEGHDLVACSHEMAGPGLEDLGWTVLAGAADASFPRMLGVNPFVVGAVGMRRRTPGELGIEGPFDETLPVHEDWDLWMRLTRAGATWAPPVEATLFTYRLRPRSMSGDLDLMWRTGMRVIGRAGATVPEQAAARREWTVRSLARAIARGDRLLSKALADFLDEATDADVGLLASSLRWALQREDVVGPRDVGAHEATWRARVEATVETRLAQRVLTRLDLRSRDWGEMARRLAARRGAGERIVLYGYGRNGRSLHDALRAHGAGDVAIIDDESRVAGLEQIGIDDLGEGDLVVVTPDDAEGMLERVQAHERVLTLATLSAPMRASA